MMDTSAYVALIEQQQDAVACSASLDSRRFPRYVTSTIIAESHRRVLFKHGRQAADRFLGAVYAGGAATIVRPDANDEREAMRFIDKYSDLNLTLCDALTFSVMLRLGIKRAFTYDRRDFWAVGIIVVPPLDI